ncbi:MAG: hypothetical protein O6831_11930 [Alphaproteobacteria bacterium]|nr:hypothetical protein [Alphaproteobacteria bacterium]
MRCSKKLTLGDFPSVPGFLSLEYRGSRGALAALLGGGATKKPPEDVTPDWEVPSMAAMVQLHKEQARG